MPVCKSAVCVCRGINRHRVYGNLRSGALLLLLFFVASLLPWLEREKNYAPINVMPGGGGGGGGGRAWGGDLTFSKNCNRGGEW